jgi:hypothetical protein
MKLVRAGSTMLAATAAVLLTSVAAATAAVPGVTSTPVNTAAQFNGRVSALLVVNGKIYVGGQFTSALDGNGKWVPRAGLAEVDATTGTLDSAWQASANKAVSALATDGTLLFVGGSFSTLDGASRKNLGAVSLATGQPTSWTPGTPDKAVLALAVMGTRVFAGGEFQAVGGSVRSHLAAFSTGTGALDPTWRPDADGKVNGITPSAAGDQLYVGGTFKAMNGNSTFGYEAGVDTGTGSNTGWPSDHVYYQIYGFALSDGAVFGGGGGPGGHLLAWGTDGSFLTDPFQTDGGVQSLATEDGQVFGGGHYTNVCLGNTGGGHPFICSDPLSRRKMFSVDIGSLTYTDWNPEANSSQGVLAMAVVPQTGALVVGGDFTTINGLSRQHFAMFPASP